VRSDEQREEERRVRERSGGDDLLAGDVDARETGRSEEADDEQVEELPRAEAQGVSSS
jgi:hypothetical protein